MISIEFQPATTYVALVEATWPTSDGKTPVVYVLTVQSCNAFFVSRIDCIVYIVHTKTHRLLYNYIHIEVCGKTLLSIDYYSVMTNEWYYDRQFPAVHSSFNHRWPQSCSSSYEVVYRRLAILSLFNHRL